MIMMRLNEVTRTDLILTNIGRAVQIHMDFNVQSPIGTTDVLVVLLLNILDR